MNNIQSNGQGRDNILSQERPMMMRGVRGATTVENDDQDEILEATRELLTMIVRVNEIEIDNIASIVLTTTEDLGATYPAFAARQLGWFDVALLCSHEMNVPGGLPHCIRILVHWNTTRSPKEIIHVYLRKAKDLRPDRDELPPIPFEEIEAAVNFDKVGQQPVADD